MKKLNVEKLKQLMDQHTAEFIERGTIGHAELIVNQEGKRVFHGFYGLKSQAERIPLGPGAMFRLASMTKPVTAVALLQQVEAGLVDLNQPITDFLPIFSHPYVGHVEDDKIVTDRPATGVIRVSNLLSHTSGIGTWPLCDIQMRPTPTRENTLADVVEYFATQALAFDPYTSQCYSPTAAFDVAARIVELVTGEEYAAHIKRTLFDPVGMKDTTFDPTPAQWERMVRMFRTDKDGRPEDHPDATKEGCVFGSIPPGVRCSGGGLASTAEDYSLFAETLLNDGLAPNGNRVLSEQTAKLLHTPFVPESMQNSSERWGLGVRVVVRPDYPEGLAVGTFGWSGAYGTHFWVDPENRVTVVYMKNTTNDGGPGESGKQVERDVSASLEG